MAKEMAIGKTQLIVSIEEDSMVSKIKQAVKLMKGVREVRVKRESLHDKILNSRAYKAAMQDVEKGNVYEVASVDEMFKKILG